MLTFYTPDEYKKSNNGERSVVNLLQEDLANWVIAVRAVMDQYDFGIAVIFDDNPENVLKVAYIYSLMMDYDVAPACRLEANRNSHLKALEKFPPGLSLNEKVDRAKDLFYE